MRVFLSTLGCRLNEAELATWRRALTSAGHTVVAAVDQAQVIVVNSCAVTGTAARKSRKLLAGLHRRNPGAALVATGCYATLEPEQAAAISGVDLVVGNTDKDDLVAILTREISSDAMPRMASEPDSTHLFADHGRTRAFVKVQDGCRNRCTYCVVTIARGDERSRALDDVIDEVNDLHASGYQEVVLTGVHLGGYGHDLGCDLRTLVATLLEQTAIPRLRLSSLEPWDIPGDFWELWQNPRLMPHLHLPLQSGSDPVLRRMGRRSSTASYATLVAGARAKIPGLTLTTDIIVGFPGESDAEWAKTMAFVARIGFGHVHIFAYSARTGTRAADLPGQVERAVTRHRSQELHTLAARSQRLHAEALVGEVREVLWEGVGEVLGPDRRRFWGYTDNYVRVATEVVGERNLGNQITRARLLQGDGHLNAEVVE